MTTPQFALVLGIVYAIVGLCGVIGLLLLPMMRVRSRAEPHRTPATAAGLR